MLEMLSSNLLGERALQIAKRAYILSAVLLIYSPHKGQNDGNPSQTKGQCKYLIVLVTPGVVLSHTEDEVENRDKCTGSVGISPEHDVAETNVVVGGDMAGSDTSEWRLLGVNLCQ